MRSPLVAIALAAYKPNIEFFRAQLQSIVDQTYINWYCVIGFDSPMSEIRDETSLQKFFYDSRFEFRQNASQLGLVGNFETTGLACLARNPKYFAYADQDDIWHADKVSKLVALLETKPPMSVVHCDMRILKRQPDDTFKLLDDTAWKIERRGVHNVTPLDFFIRNIAAGAGMLMDADLVRRYPKIPGDVYGQDHWYPTVASFFGGVHPLAEALYDYRIHGNNVAGIRPYYGFLSTSRSSSELGYCRKCLVVFNSTRARLQYAEAAKLPVTSTQKLIVSNRADLGLGYLFKAILIGFNDRALARACVARAFGKMIGLFCSSSIETARL